MPDRTINLRIDPKIYARLLRIARARRWSLSEAVRVAVEEFIERAKKEEGSVR